MTIRINEKQMNDNENEIGRSLPECREFNDGLKNSTMPQNRPMLLPLKCPEIMKPLSSETQYVLSLPNSWLGSDTKLMRVQGWELLGVVQG